MKAGLFSTVFCSKHPLKREAHVLALLISPSLFSKTKDTDGFL